MRQDKLTNRWVVFVPERALRPHEAGRQAAERENLPEREPDCPFCAGNEAMLPAILFELPARGQQGWQTRVVQNKYPVLRTEAHMTAPHADIHSVAPAYGRHEVILETPLHNHDLPLMLPGEAEAVVETYTRRYAALYSTDERVESIVIFRNHGEKAGTSRRHPHSQLVGVGMVPEFIARRERVADEYFCRNNRCALCDVMEFEQSDRTRLVCENSLFLAFAPLAAEVPCEVWIVPKRHGPDFGLIANHEKERLAAILQDALQRYYDRLNDPAYSYVIHSYSRQESIVPYLHWYAQIRPRLTTRAGFEIGSEMPVNASLPEHDAQTLRETPL